MNDRFLRAARQQPVDATPVWLMRQAGRYLPEYRELRVKHDMLTMCRTPELAVEATLQPLRRFDLDAAILFSDIMVPLPGMGIEFGFKESGGPVIASPVRDLAAAEALRVGEPERDVPFVLEAIRILRRELGGRVPLIGFSGAPFTLASYVIEGGPSRDLLRTKAMMHEAPETWKALMEKLAVTVGAYLGAQIRAGVQAVQLFDSWAGALGPDDYRDHVLPYSSLVFDSLKGTGVPAIHFGTGTAGFIELLRKAGGDVIGVDWRINVGTAWNRLGNVAVQGNLDPATMLATPDIVERAARAVLDSAAGRPGHIFNLGHGILPQTPIENVERLVRVVHDYRAPGKTTG